MIIKETKLKGACIIDLERIEDHRGFFARTWCQQELQAHGLIAHIAQINMGFSKKRETLRGMHYQLPPFQEVKIVRCTMGAIYCVTIDLRIDSNTYKQWLGVELTAENLRALYIPEGFAHGFITLEDDSQLIYHHTSVYKPGYERSIYYNDPAVGINWPIETVSVSEKDQNVQLIDSSFYGI